jgi:DNA-binding IscR family transcriptional regulator
MLFETDRFQLFLMSAEKMQPNAPSSIAYCAGESMSVKSVQFTVAAHIMVALGYFHGEEIPSAALADSVNANPSFVRTSLSKLSKAGLGMTKRGKSGASVLARPPRQITLLDIYLASTAPPAFSIHSYPVNKRCPVSCNLKECVSGVLSQAQYSFERSLAKITLANLVGQIREKAL